jgi:hypothetical protein
MVHHYLEEASTFTDTKSEALILGSGRGEPNEVSFSAEDFLKITTSKVPHPDFAQPPTEDPPSPTVSDLPLETEAPTSSPVQETTPPTPASKPRVQFDFNDAPEDWLRGIPKPPPSYPRKQLQACEMDPCPFPMEPIEPIEPIPGGPQVVELALVLGIAYLLGGVSGALLTKAFSKTPACASCAAAAVTLAN